MRERDVEKLLVDGVKKLGGLAYKFVSPGNDGVPDRIIVMPGYSAIFVELKTDTGRLSARQKIQLQRLDDAGQPTEVLYGEKDVRAFLEYLTAMAIDGGEDSGI